MLEILLAKRIRACNCCDTSVVNLRVKLKWLYKHRFLVNLAFTRKNFVEFWQYYWWNEVKHPFYHSPLGKYIRRIKSAIRNGR